MTVARAVQLTRELAAYGTNVGYDQAQRWSWLDKTNRSIIPGRECDCSTAAAGILWLSGVPIDLADPCYTGNLAEKAKAAGCTLIPVTGWTLEQIVAALKPGDALIGPGHVVSVVDPWTWFSAEQDENGSNIGGRAGDQTAREVLWRKPYLRSRGWVNIIRPPQDPVPVPAVATTLATTSLPTLKVGVRGPLVGSVQSFALSHFGTYAGGIKRTGGADNIYGDATARWVSEFQRRTNLAADGIVGPKTWAMLGRYGWRREVAL